MVEKYLAGGIRLREAARWAGVGHSTMENWVIRYHSEGVTALRENGNAAKHQYSEALKRKVIANGFFGVHIFVRHFQSLVVIVIGCARKMCYLQKDI